MKNKYAFTVPQKMEVSENPFSKKRPIEQITKPVEKQVTPIKKETMRIDPEPVVDVIMHDEEETKKPSATKENELN
jgi:hypothetical protein